MGVANASSLALPAGDAHTGTAHDDVEVHTENTDSGVVLDTEVDVLVDTETEVAGGGEVAVWSACDVDSSKSSGWSTR